MHNKSRKVVFIIILIPFQMELGCTDNTAVITVTIGGYTGIAGPIFLFATMKV